MYTSNTTLATYFWSTIKSNFTDAEQYCRARGAQLAAWLSAAEQVRPAGSRRCGCCCVATSQACVSYSLFDQCYHCLLV
jgi:hypothetical protein